MNAASSRTVSQQIAGEIQLARLRVAKAENQLKSAKQQARLARRRRKEAKQAARRAKKQAKLAKQEFAEAEQALADAEAKLLRSHRRPIMTKAGRRVNRPGAVPLRTPTKTRASKSPMRKPASKSKSKVQATAQPVVVPGDLEVQTATATSPGGMAVVQTERPTVESSVLKTAGGKPVKPASLDSRTP